MNKKDIDMLLGGDLWPVAFVLSSNFLTFADLIPNALIISDPQGKILQVNQQAEIDFAASREQLLKLSIEDLLPAELRKHHILLRKKFFADPKPRFMQGRDSSLRGLRRDNVEFPMDAALFCLQTDKGPLAVNLIHDISDRELKESSISRMALIDEMTELPNRHYFNDVFARIFAKSRRYNQSLVLVYIDLDKFKPVNDQYGHHVGDALLAQVGQRLKATLRKEDFVARIGGDEFVVVISPVENPQQMTRVAERLMASIEKPYKVEQHSHSISASIGIAFLSDDDNDPESLLMRADQAMYAVKRAK